MQACVGGAWQGSLGYHWASIENGAKRCWSPLLSQTSLGGWEHFKMTFVDPVLSCSYVNYGMMSAGWGMLQACIREAWSQIRAFLSGNLASPGAAGAGGSCQEHWRQQFQSSETRVFHLRCQNQASCQSGTPPLFAEQETIFHGSLRMQSSWLTIKICWNAAWLLPLQRRKDAVEAWSACLPSQSLAELAQQACQC